MESEPPSRWRAEPFRLFFPLAVVLAWVGIGHWLLYVGGVTATYSCLAHGLVQMQAFMMAFAVGFLLTALPRRTQSAPPGAGELAAASGALVLTTAAAIAERWALAELAYGALVVLILRFALSRFLGRGAGRRPPAAFVLLPIGAAQGLAGAALIVACGFPAVPAWTMPLGRLLVEQGVFLCLVIGIGGLVTPLIAGAPPPPDIGADPAGRRRAAGYAGLGLGILGTLVLEQAGWTRAAPLARAALVAYGVGLATGWRRAPGKPGLHRRLVWLALWLMPIGLAGSGIWPDYRVPALHVLFIGGFSLLAFAVATHVTLSHLGPEELARGRPPAVVAVAVGILLAMLARVAADWSDAYFVHLGWAAGLWIAGSAAWLAFFGPRLLRAPADASRRAVG